jgi:hypothetical protein
MATIAAKSAERTKCDTIPQVHLSTEELKGRVRIHKTTYTWLAGYVDSGSTITGTLLPKGARIVGGRLSSQAGVASHTLQVAINAVNLAAALAVGAITVQTDALPDKDNFQNVDGVDFGGYAPVITTAGAAAVAGNKVSLILFYVVD